MLPTVLKFLACPECAGGLQIAERDGAGDVIMTGSLRCSNAQCGRVVPVRRGIPRFVADAGEQAATARHFGLQWSAYLRGKFEADSVYGVTQEQWIQYFLRSTGLNKSDLAGMRILDGGCGSAKLAAALAPFGCEIVCLDIHDGLDLVLDRFDGLENVHVVQGDLLNLPIAPGTFDLVWSSGVIHHTPDPRRAFRNLARATRSGGRMYIWVYGVRPNPYRMIRDTVRFGHALPAGLLYPLSYAMAVPLYATFNGWHLLARRKGRAAFGFNQAESRWRSFGEISMTMFDNFNPKYHFRYRHDELERWFLEDGFAETLVTDTLDSGVCGFRQPASA